VTRDAEADTDAEAEAEAEAEMKADRRLAGLVADAAHDPLAARIVLQRLLPGLLSIARRRGGRHGALTLRLYHELLGNAWLVIRCYPIERRPYRVAANLLRDVEYQTFVREARLSRIRPEPWDATALEDLDPAAAPLASRDLHPFDEVVDALSEAKQAGARPDTVRFAAAVASGRSLRELAEERRVTVRAERYRREQVMSELRTLLDPTREDDTPDRLHG
jgi:hypothetical protein